jgi:hypothetical protein
MTPAWPASAKRTQQASPMQSPKRGKTDPRAFQTPSKQTHFLSHRCPPSPHYKPLASSPLRSSAISPIVTIKRPEPRQPLGQLTVILQGPGNSSRRITSNDFKLYEDPTPFKDNNVLIRPPISPTRINDKENIPPIARQSLEKDMYGDLFMQAKPRCSLSELTRLDKTTSEISATVETETTVAMEEIVTIDYFAGAKITHEIYKMDISKTKVTTRLDSFRSITREENWEFGIHQDDTEDQDMVDYDSGVESVKGEEENKENVDPGGDEINLTDLRKSWSKKRKYSNEFM